MSPIKTDECSACGSNDFSINDGFKYCNRCGALLENFEELEEEEGGNQKTLGKGKVKVIKADSKKRIRNDVAPINIPKTQVMSEALEKRSEFLKKQAVKNEELSLPHDATPDYLYRLGLRLFSFTQILAKASYILVKELNFDHHIEKTILATFQRYLSHCKVAFCHSEQCGNDEQLRFVALMENIRYEEEEREEKRRKKLARRGKGVSALSKSAAVWTLLTQGNITENLDLASDAEDEEEVEYDREDVSCSLKNLELTQDGIDESIAVNDTTFGFVRKVTTALSKEALRRASQLILNLELLVALLHSALMSSGYRNVFVSDIVRWIREDRFRISRRAIRLIRQSQPERKKHNEVNRNTAVDFAEPFLRIPLYEIVRTCTIFNQSLHLTNRMVPQSFQTLAARLIDNLNLPVDILSRILLLESIVPCDVSPLLLKQVDTKMGYNFEQLTALSPKLYYEGFMSSFGRKERGFQEQDATDEVLLSADTKLVAYLLLTLRLTFDLEEAQCHLDSLDQKFNIDAWIHQLEMRLKCWQGHDMSMVLRSSCPIPEMNVDQPLGSHYGFYGEKGISFAYRRRRQVGFQKCIPPDMSFNSTSTLPTVFDVRHNRFPAERRHTEAVMAPLKFQRVVLRKEMVLNQKKFLYIDPQSERTFFEDFSTSKITESADSFDKYFPLASRYSIYKRPDWIQNCVARKSHMGHKTGPLRFYLSNHCCDDLLGVATPYFSRRFQFLLEAFSLLIGEDQKAVYAAFVMLEMYMTSPGKLETYHEKLLTSTPIVIKGQKFRSSMNHEPCENGIISFEPVEKMEDLSLFRLSHQYFEREEISSAELIDSRHQQIRDSLTPEESQKIQRKFLKKCYDFETFYGILAVKIW